MLQVGKYLARDGIGRCFILVKSYDADDWGTHVCSCGVWTTFSLCGSTRIHLTHWTFILTLLTLTLPSFLSKSHVDKGWLDGRFDMDGWLVRFRHRVAQKQQRTSKQRRKGIFSMGSSVVFLGARSLPEPSLHCSTRDCQSCKCMIIRVLFLPGQVGAYIFWRPVITKHDRLLCLLFWSNIGNSAVAVMSR